MDKHLKPLFIIIAVMVVFGFLMRNGSIRDNMFTNFDNQLQDSSFQKSHEKDIDERIVIIAIDEESLDALRAWPWDRSIHAKLIEQLSAEHSAAIGFDVIFAEPSENPLSYSALAAFTATSP